MRLKGSTGQTVDRSVKLQQSAGAGPSVTPIGQHLHTFELSKTPPPNFYSQSAYMTSFSPSSPPKIASHALICLDWKKNSTKNVTVAGIPQAKSLSVERPLSHPIVGKVLRTTSDWLCWWVVERGFNLPDEWLADAIQWVIRNFHSDVSPCKYHPTFNLCLSLIFGTVAIMAQERVPFGPILRQQACTTMRDDFNTVKRLVVQEVSRGDDRAMDKTTLYQMLDTNLESPSSMLQYNSSMARKLLLLPRFLAFHLYCEGHSVSRTLQ